MLMLMLTIAAFPVVAACGPATKDGVGVAPLRPGPAQIRYEQTRPSMGGFLLIRVVAPESRERKVEAALEKAFAATDAWEALLSEWKPESPVSRINAAAGVEPVEVPKDVVDAFKKAMTVSHASKGAFDLSFAGMERIWDFRPETTEHRIPTADERTAARAKVDWRKIEIDEVARTVFLPEKGMKVSFGGIGQGIGADAAAEVLREEGFDDFVVDLSGDAYIAGDAGGEAWKAGIQDPRALRGSVVATLAVRDGAVETSGDYEKFFIGDDGIRYHHILDPRTGAPSRGLASVTVLARDVTTADAYGTAAFAAGPVEGLALLRARGLDAVLISAPEDGLPSVMTVTSGLKGRLDVSAWKGRIEWVASGH